MYEFEDFFKKNDSEFNSIFINRNESTNLSTYYKAAIILFPNNEQLLQLKPKFDVVQDVENCTIAGLGKLKDLRVVSWHFGLTKELFLTSVNLSKERKNSIVSVIETELLKL